MTPQRILIDTDPGQDIDDLLAMWFALLRPELDIVAITTVTHPSDGRARLVKRLLRHLGREDVPVGAGMQLPLRRFSPAEWTALAADLARTMNHASFAEPADERDRVDADAIDLIISTVERHPGEIILACIAPLTNIATALRRRPDLAGKIKAIALMGGETSLNRTEHNIAWDPVAADIIFGAGIPIAMGTWDITRRFVLSLEECARFRELATPLGSALADAVLRWHPAQNWKPGPVMYDLFPMIWAYDRTLYQTSPMNVHIEQHGSHTSGMTVIRPDATQVEVTTGIDAAAVRALYLQTIGLAP